MQPAVVVIDIRPQELYRFSHIRGSHSFPLAAFEDLKFALPPRSSPLLVIHAGEVGWVSKALVRLGFQRVTFLEFSGVEPSSVVSGEEEILLQRQRRCWEPCSFLNKVVSCVEADLSRTVASNGVEDGSHFVAVDVGCGSGRDMCFLAMRGWTVVGFDNRPELLRRCRLLSERHSCAARTHLVMCHVATTFPFRARSADLVVVVRFLHRGTLPLLFDMVAPGGYLLYSHFLDGCQSIGKCSPSTPQGYFFRGELEKMCQDRSDEFELRVSEESVLDDGRPIINFLARRCGTTHRYSSSARGTDSDEKYRLGNKFL